MASFPKLPLLVLLAATSVLLNAWLLTGRLSSGVPPSREPPHEAPAPARPVTARGNDLPLGHRYPKDLSPPALPASAAPLGSTPPAAVPPSPPPQDPGFGPAALASAPQTGPGVPKTKLQGPAESAGPQPSSIVAYEIPAGMRAPVALLPDDPDLTAPVRAYLDKIREEFDATIRSAADPDAVWEEARDLADRRYQAAFGDDAYNRKTMQDAMDALDSGRPTP